MFKYNKGEYGYINEYKKRKLTFSGIFLFMILFIVITMLIMFGSTKRVMVVFAILLALPFSKFIIGYIVCFKFKSLSKSDHEKILKSYKDSADELLFDMTISQYEGIKYYDSMLIKNNIIVALVTSKNYKKDKKSYETWIKKCFEDSKYSYSIFIYNDMDSYLKKINSISEPGDKNKLVDRHIKERIIVMGV